MVTIKTNLIKQVNATSDDGLVLLIFKNARDKDTQGLRRINQLQELYDNYELDDTNVDSKKKSARELFVAEYLLNRGTNLVILTTAAVGTIAPGDLTILEEEQDINYNIILVPYSLQTTGTVDTNLITFLKDNENVELYLDLDPELDATALGTLKGVIAVAARTDEVAHRVSLFASYGLVGSDSVSNYAFTFTEGTEKTYSNKEFFTEANSYYGIPSSAVVASRKAVLLINQTPWVPVAGENNGVVPEFTKLYKKYSLADKKTIQGHDINLIHFKMGLGHLLVSQNTLARTNGDKDINPLIRSHVVTQALWIKRRIKSITEKILFEPHDSRTYNSWETSVNSFFNLIMGQRGITKFQAVTGTRVMTQNDINNNLFKGVVAYHPMNVVESAIITLNILETHDTEIVVEGV